ncbi:MAG: amphi-Trp domain-containing protein [Anaerolineales bacterium]
MSKKTTLFKSEERHDLREVAAFLRELADRLESGEVVLQQGDREVNVRLPDRVELEIEVEKKEKKRKTKHSLEIEIEWKEGDFSGGPVTLG